MSTRTAHPDQDAEALIAAFARHETFHPRFGWLKKGYDAAVIDPQIFIRSNATTVLGVGKNMVRAIRYWCVAYKVLREEVNAENFRLRDAHPTDLGDRLLGEDGWDPYLEDPASLWLLHWKLLARPCRAPAWWAVFNDPQTTEFTDASLAKLLRRFCDQHPDWEIVDNSLLKDARCLLRMYASATTKADLPEDSVDSPWAELDILRPVVGAPRHYTRALGAKRDLPDAILAHAALEHVASRGSGAKVIGISTLAHEPGGPGRAFGVTETVLADALTRTAKHHPDLAITDAAGARQLTVRTEPADIAYAVLENHYSRRLVPA